MPTILLLGRPSSDCQMPRDQTELVAAGPDPTGRKNNAPARHRGTGITPYLIKSMCRIQVPQKRCDRPTMVSWWNRPDWFVSFCEGAARGHLDLPPPLFRG